MPRRYTPRRKVATRRRAPPRRRSYIPRRALIKATHEPKSANVSTASTAPGTTWTELNTGLDTIVQGDGASSRDGNRIYAGYLRNRTLLTTNNNASSNPYQGFRMMIIHHYGGATVTASDLPTNGMTGVPSRDNLAKYKVIFDRTWYVNKDINVQNAKELLVQINKKLGFTMTYASSATAAPIRGNISIWCISDDNTYSGSFTAETRLYFRGM